MEVLLKDVIQWKINSAEETRKKKKRFPILVAILDILIKIPLPQQFGDNTLNTRINDVTKGRCVADVARQVVDKPQIHRTSSH